MFDLYLAGISRRMESASEQDRRIADARSARLLAALRPGRSGALAAPGALYRLAASVLPGREA